MPAVTSQRLHVEAILVVLLAAACGAALAATAGYWGWTWDAMNHHVYLGLIAEQPRWHLDVAAANNQTYQYPYLYWPIYRIALMDGNGQLTHIAWASAQAALVVMPVWLISHRLLAAHGGITWEQSASRIAACAMALMSAVVLLGLPNSSNDLLAALPLMWALALHLGAPLDLRRAAWCGALFGVSVAFKWSNGLAIPILLFWWWMPTKPHWPLRRAFALAGGAALGFSLAYAPWGLQLWRLTGNPFHPFFHAWFGR